jgi:hypothetical protein
MATEIITNINSVLEQKGIRVSANFVQSTFNPAFYQFSFATPGDLNIGDYIRFTSEQLGGFIVDITGLNVTIDTIPYNVFLPPSFTELIILPPTAGSENFDVRVVAAFNPVVIEMRRKDYEDNTLQSTWNSLYVSIPCGTVFMGEWVLVEGFEVGAVIQVIADNSANAFNHTILNISSSGGILYATFDKLFSAFSPFFLASINFTSRLNFYVTLRIKNGDFVPIYRDLRFTPDSNAFIRAEISGALRSLINLNFTIDLIDPNAARTEDTNLYTPFYFATKDNWIGSSESFITYYDPEDVKFAIAGAFQIGDPNNGYYNKYFANTAGSSFYPEVMPQWLTQFENPVFFPLFPFTLSFLGNSTLTDFEEYIIKYTVTQANGNITPYESAPIVFTEFISLARINITEIVYAEFIGNEILKAKKMEIRFGRYDETLLFIDCLAPITLNVKRPLEQSCNTFYVRWLNTLGGWDYWLFEHKIYEALNVENGNNYESYFDNISGISDFENVTFKNVSPAVQVGSSTLTKNEAEGLKVLTTSPKIYWYNEELEKWIGVIIEPGTFNIRSTKDNYFNIELTFVKPKYFNQYA